MNLNRWNLARWRYYDDVYTHYYMLRLLCEQAPPRATILKIAADSFCLSLNPGVSIEVVMKLK